MPNGNYISEYLGLASAATTSPGATPQYGLVYDLSSGQWVNAAQFKQFVRDSLPATQTGLGSTAQSLLAQQEQAKELQRATNYQAHDLFMTSDELGLNRSGIGNQIQTGFKAASGYLHNAGSAVGNAIGDLFHGHVKEALYESVPSYSQYAAKGGLLTEDQFNQFNDKTKVRLFTSAVSKKGVVDVATAPGVKQGLEGLGLAYRGAVTGAEMVPQLAHGNEFFSPDKWAQAWRESNKESLGNALVNTVLDPFVSDETLARWRRDNPWYQMTSAGTELVASWYADPATVATKGAGGAARFARGELPLNDASAYSTGLRQHLMREPITVKNPVTRQVINFQGKRMDAGWADIHDYARAVSAPEFARTMPMFSARARAVDGGAGAYALHWAINNSDKAADILESPTVRQGLQDVADTHGFQLPDKLDFADLTQQLMLSDPKAWAMINKLQEITPAELQKFAPGAQTLLDALHATTTRADGLQSQIDDLLAEADRIDQGTSTSKAIPMFHRWEVHTSLADKQKQLADVTDTLHKYDGYQDWLNLLTTEKPAISRVQKPSAARWSDVRARTSDETETRSLFQDNQFGAAHSYHAISKGLFLKRANIVEIHKLDSGLMAINRQFDQYEHLFGYAPEGVRDTYLNKYVGTRTMMNRYEIQHDLEETHLPAAIAQKFGVDPELARAIVHKINDERNRTIQGILNNEGTVYRSAPSLAERLGGEDATAELVGYSDDGATATINIVNDLKHKQTYQVPAEALTQRVHPEDVTQTPNYYNPLDTRRLYHELKHNRDMLDELQAGFVQNARAALADTAERVGTQFHNIWKPFQLFRLGWPMRVLMDEGMRATAIYGPMYWVTGPGAEAIYHSARNIIPALSDMALRRRHGSLGVDLSSPITKARVQSPNPFERDAEVLSAPMLPEKMVDKINPDRAERVAAHVQAARNFTAAKNRAAYWQGRDLPERADLREYAKRARAFDGKVPPHPMHRVVSDYERGSYDSVFVHEPTTGRSAHNGYVVPTSAPISVRSGEKALLDWYGQHAELLSRSGMRIMVTPDGALSVGRHFGSNEFAKAHQYAQFTTDPAPAKMWDLSRKRSLEITEPHDPSPMVAAMYQKFSDLEHGDEVLVNSREGIHTTIPRAVAEQHGTTGVYSVRVGKKRVRIYDADANPDAYRQIAERGEPAVLTRQEGSDQRYIWISPEDLTVRPAYADIKGYATLPEWFSHPASIEKPLMEARQRAAQEAGELRARETESQDFDIHGFDAEMDSPTSWLMNKMQERHHYGAKVKKVTTSDGKTFYVNGAFAGHKGQLFRGLTASNGALDVLSEGHGSGTSLFRRKSEGYRVYNPPAFDKKAITDFRSKEHKEAVRYFQAYADTINDHLGSSPIVQRMLKGANDDDLIHWLDSTAEGARIRDEIKPPSTPTGVWVDDMRYKLNYYVPSKKLQRLLTKGRLKPSDFRKNVADEDLPSIYGPDLEILDRRRGLGEFASDVADRMWEGLGNVPIDRLSRHPFAKAVYDSKVRSQVAALDSKWMTPDMIEHITQTAHAHAMNEVRKTLYNLTDTTNFNDALRFVAPFWGAQYEAITKWLRIISDRPETVARFFAGQRAVYNNFAVVDQNGDPVKSGVRPGGLHNLGLYHPNDRVIVQMPKAMKKLFGMEYVGSVGIPVGSANTVLQGDLPLLPGFGPLVTIPADQFMRHVSDTYGVEHANNLLYRWMFPIGRPREKGTLYQVLDQLSPGWSKRVMQAGSPEDDQSRINMEMQVGREMYLRAREQGKPDPSPGDIKKAADHLFAVRIISGLIQPFQTQYLPDHQYWVDAAHRYQRQYGSEWWDKYVDDYGDEAAIFATSSSNSVGVPPTSQGMQEWSQNKNLIERLTDPKTGESKWAAAIISPQAYMAPFNSDAYGQQFNINLGPGDTQTLRSGSSLRERLEVDPQERLGWREYRKVNAAIEAELSARGLTNIQQRGAEDLAQIKRAAVSDLTQKYPAWAKAYETDSQTIYSDVQDLKSFAYESMFDNRPDMQGVRSYLAIRQKVTDALDAYGANGGSRSLQAQENGALRDWFYDQVGQLVLDNPSFAEFYSRYLDSDTLTQGGGGF